MANKFLNGIHLNNQRAQSLADPTAATDAATKQYVDNLIAGLRWKAPVRVATTATGTLASAFANGQTVDGIVLATGDRILIKDQSSAAENGIYVVAASGAPTRATDADSTAELENATVFVSVGTVNADKAYTQTATVTTVGTTAQTWVQFNAGAAYTADGNGIELSSTTFSIELDGTTLAKSAAGLRVGSGAAGAGLTEASGVLAVGSGTGISVAADAISIDSSVVVRKYAVNIGDGSTTAITVTHSLNTLDVQVQVVEVSTGETVYPDVARNAVNTCVVTFAVAPTSNQYRVIVQG